MKEISASVGKNGVNHPADVRTIQTLLNRHASTATHKLKVDGLIGPKTIQRIESYQSKALKFTRPDGKIDPKGRTLLSLISPAQISLPLKHSLLTFSSRAITYIKALESLSLQPYDDQTGQEISDWVTGATIGYGHLISQSDWNKYKNGISDTQAETLLNLDLSPFLKIVKSAITIELNQHQFDALVIFAFNIGTGGFSKSSVVKLINDPDAKTGYPSLKAAWMAWTKSQGREMKGLIKRRQAEWSLYERGLYP